MDYQIQIIKVVGECMRVCVHNETINIRREAQGSRWIASPFLSPVLVADGLARLRNATRGNKDAAPPRPKAVYIRNQKVASTMLDEQAIQYAGAKVPVEANCFHSLSDMPNPLNLRAHMCFQGEHLRLRFRHAGGSPRSCAPNVFLTFVRDPIKKHSFRAGCRFV